MASCEQTTTSKKVSLDQKPFSHSTLKLEGKKLHGAKPLAAFSLHVLPVLGSPNHYSNLTSKIGQLVNRIPGMTRRLKSVKKLPFPLTGRY